MTQWFLTALTGLLLLVTLLPLWKNPSWWVRVWEFPRLQISILALLLLVALALLLPYSTVWHGVLGGLALACLIYQLWWITPYTRLWRCEVKPGQASDDKPRISIMAANVLATNRQAGRLLALVHEYQPDILVALEPDAWWDRQFDQLAQEYPNSIRCPLDNLYGMVVLSRLPLEDPELCFLVEDDKPSMHARVRLNEQLSVRMHFLHPAPPSPTENEESTERDVELLVVAKKLKARGNEPVIVAGDLNDVAWSPTTHLFRKISGLLDPRVGRGMFNTFHAEHWFLRWPLDHFFHSSHFELLRIVRLPHFGSDHFPVFIELQYAQAHEDPERGLQADADDEREAQERIQGEDASSADVPEPGDSKQGRAAPLVAFATQARQPAAAFVRCGTTETP